MGRPFRRKHGEVARMPHTPTVREGIFLGLFVALQFFWLFSAFAYSDTRLQERPPRDETRESAERDPGTAPPPLPNIALPFAAPETPNAPSIQFPTLGAPRDPSRPGAPSSPTTPGPDLGSQIKYCIVFPFLNAIGEPIPTFDVPECPLSPPPPGPPKLTVIKVVVNDDKGSATTTDFMLRVGSTIVQSGVQRTFSPGTYDISEATTTVTIGTTTQKYVPEFSGDCDATGRITLSAGDIKTCTILNDDEGPGGQGGDSGGGDNGGSNGGNGGGPSGGGPSEGGPSGGSSGGSSGGPPGQVAGAVAPPDFTGGADGEPGAPNAGAGGLASENIGLLLFSFASALLGFLYLFVFAKIIKPASSNFAEA